jgi:hypothetical protein
MIIYDIYVLVTKKQTITSVFKKWYKEKPFVPYAVGGLFIGHFQTLINVKCIPFFIIFTCLFFAWTFFIKRPIKVYDIMCKYFYIPMIIGVIVGSFWR